MQGKTERTVLIQDSRRHDLGGDKQYLVSLMTKPNTELGEEVVSVLHNAPPHLLMMSASVGIRTVRLAFPQGHQRKHGSHQRHYQAAS